MINMYLSGFTTDHFLCLFPLFLIIMNTIYPDETKLLMFSCSPRVSFCGYSIPHPSDNRVNIRVQTTGNICSSMMDMV